MRIGLIRAIVAGVAIVLWWWLLLAWVLDAGFGTPWAPQANMSYAGNRLDRVLGTATVDARGMRVDDLGDYRQALQTWRLATPLEADDYRVLRYHVDGLPRTVELDLVVRNSENPGDVSLQRLPWPRHGTGNFDLATLPAWRGRILEIGFSEMDAVGQVPPQADAPAFTIVGATLESPSWRGALAVLASDWFAYRPWSLSAINTVRADDSVSVRRSPVLLLGLGVAGSLLLLVVVAGLRRRRLAIAAVASFALAWLALDLAWLAQWQQRDAVTRAAFAGQPWEVRAGMQPDPEVLQLAQRLRAVLERQPPGQRVLLWTPNKRDAIRIGWFLRPFNVAVLPEQPLATAIPDGTLLVVAEGEDRWRYDPEYARLDHEGSSPYRDVIFRHGLDRARGDADVGDFEVHGDLIYRSGELMVLSVREGAGS